ncbi:hypothetical protein B7P43_G16387 [Cryptotermes secundus]|uniref:Integrase catalytic domain-containing protein n=1 Tax=Cryptotermes secundus TaxID=105785 RepID=A0A2J7QM25_9NEOP|nr:hypothetical protein B7P43_G16387 [Cryptotermes secundus]
MDYFTKCPEVYAIPNQEASTIAEVLVANFFCRFDIPRELHSDQSRKFESHLLKEVLQRLGVSKTRTTPLNPQSDGMVDRYVKTIEEHLRKVVASHQTDWDESDLLFGVPPDKEQPTTDYAGDLVDHLHDIHNYARQHLKLASDRMKTRYDKLANSAGYDEGDRVWLYRPTRRKGKSPKLQASWEGPYKVVTRINDVVYRIQKTPRSRMLVVHLDRLAPYHGAARDEQP